MRCEHWTVGDHESCPEQAAVVITCAVDVIDADDPDGEPWTGALCAQHFADYVDDPEIVVMGAREVER